MHCLNSSNNMFALGGGCRGICSCNNPYSSHFSIALFDRLLVALALALGRARFNMVEHLHSMICNVSKHIFDQN